VDPLLVITNADAGTADDEALEAALAILRESCSVEVQATSKPGELDGVLQRAASRRIVVAGGDGSLHAVIAALHRRHDLDEAVVGLIPMGTGNDFARSLEIPLDVEEAARVIVAGKIRPMDVIVDELGEVVVNNVHIGAGAQASRRGARWKERLGSVGVGSANLGKLGYPIGALLAAFHPPSVHMHVEVDGEVVTDVDRPVLMVSVGNGAHVGGGTELTPETGGQDRLRRTPEPWGPPPPRRRAVPPGDPGRGVRRRVLDQRRRRDQRTGAAAHLARRAGCLLVHPPGLTGPALA